MVCNDDGKQRQLGLSPYCGIDDERAAMGQSHSRSRGTLMSAGFSRDTH